MLTVPNWSQITSVNNIHNYLNYIYCKRVTSKCCRCVWLNITRVQSALIQYKYIYADKIITLFLYEFESLAYLNSEKLKE